MRELSETDTKALGALLGSGLETQRQAMQRAGLSRSTFTAARKRAFDEGWVYERGIPAPPAGFGHVALVLARPFADSSAGVGDALVAQKGAVLVWQALDMVFGVILARGEGSGVKLASGLFEGGEVQSVTAWDVDLSTMSIPVYFDYEGAFSHLTGLPVTAYPRPFPSAGPRGKEEGHSDAFLQKLRDITERPFRGAAVSGELHRFGTAGFPRSWRRLIARGFTDWRVFPDFSRIPAYRGTSLTRVALIHGELKKGSTPAGLFSELVGTSRVYPFLYVADERTVLIGALGRSRTAPEEGGSRAPVLPLLQRHLSGVTVVSSDFEGLEVRLDHRYDRLFT